MADERLREAGGERKRESWGRDSMSSSASLKQHAVCVPFPAQGHINPLVKVAKLLHIHGFYVTFVLTEFNRRRLIRSSDKEAVKGLPDFKFATIPDGLPFSDDDVTQDVPSLCDSTSRTCLPPFRLLLSDLNNDDSLPPVSCIISDSIMTFALDAAQELGIPGVLFCTTSATALLAFTYYRKLIDRGLLPLKDMADITNGFLETEVDGLPGLMKGIRLKDFPSFIRTVDADDIMINFGIREIARAALASAIMINTFESIEQPAIATLENILPVPFFPVGPLSLLSHSKIATDSPLNAICTSLWKEDSHILNWLEGRRPASVVYVNFGSVTVMTNEQLVEFAWGLAGSDYDFIWVLRPDLVRGESAALPPEFVEETKGRGVITGWCAQERVLMHPAVGVFLTHAGWNSMLESLSAGVPMICWPFFAEQQTNCRYACAEWGVGMEIDSRVRRKEVEGLTREVMDGEKGREMRRKAAEWKEKTAEATRDGGPSEVNFKGLINDVLLPN